MTVSIRPIAAKPTTFRRDPLAYHGSHPTCCHFATNGNVSAEIRVGLDEPAPRQPRRLLGRRMIGWNATLWPSNSLRARRLSCRPLKRDQASSKGAT